MATAHPAFADRRIRSLSALHLRVRAIELGVPVLYRDQPGILEGGELSAAPLVANLVTNQMLDPQRRRRGVLGVGT